MGFGFLCIGQILRGLATRKYLSYFTQVRHRDIFTINAIGSLTNLVFPLRIGDIGRIFLFSRKNLKIQISTAFVIIERVTDLLVVNLVILFSSIFIPSVPFGQLNALGIFVSLTFLIIFYSSAKTTIVKKINFLLIFYHFKSICNISAYRYFFSMIFLNWIFTFTAIYILSLNNVSILQSWVNFNTKLGDPLTIIFRRDFSLMFTLLIPIIGAWIYSTYFPSSRKVAEKALDVLVRSDHELTDLKKFSSNFAGSGDELFQAKINSRNNDKIENVQNVIVKVSKIGTVMDSIRIEDFLRLNNNIYNFPKILISGVYRKRYYLLYELISDDSSDKPSLNAYEFIKSLEQKNKFEVMKEALEYIYSTGERTNTADPLKNEIYDCQNDDIAKRLRRSESISYLFLNVYRKNDRVILEKLSNLIDRLIIDLNKNSHKIKIGVTHGDATLSNLLIQRNSDKKIFWSIDPNPRFPVGNLEFDLSKIMQSTHFMYEELISFKGNERYFFNNFKQIREDQGLVNIFNSIIRNDEYYVDVNLLNLFFLIHLIRLIPYKTNETKEFFSILIQLIIQMEDDVHSRP